MTQLSFEAGKRVPLLDLAPVTKPVRPGATSSDQFDSHLNRASTAPSAPASNTATPTGPASRQSASSTSETNSSESHQDDSSAAAVVESDSGQADHNNNSSATTSGPYVSNQPPAKKSDSHKENDQDDEDEVMTSEASIALVQQLAIVDPNVDVKIDEELGEMVEDVTELGKKKPNQGEDLAQAKPKRQLAQGQTAAPSANGTKPSAIESPKNTAAPASPPAEAAMEVTQPVIEDVALAPADHLAAKPTVSTNQEITSAVQRATTITIKDGQTDESLVLGPSSSLPEETEGTAVSEEVQPEPTSKPEITANSARTSNQASETGMADSKEQPVDTQPESSATSGELPPDMNSNGESASEQGEKQFEQRAEQSGASAVDTKTSVTKSPPIESSPATKQMAPVTEAAPIVRAEHSTSAANGTSGNDSMSAADRARFVQRVSRALHIAHERGGEVRLRLSPPELGNLTLELRLQDGAMTAHIEAETSAARTLLLDNLPVLKERLAAQDIKVERFDVELRDQSGQQSPNGQSPDSEAERNVRHAMKKPVMNGIKVEEKRTTPSVQPTSTSGQLNVII